MSTHQTDRELLELAAKAADYQYAKHGGYIVVDGIPGNWNPLTDDGDALRLAVKLNISILRPVDGDNKAHWGTYASMPNQTDIGKEHDNGDPCAATRRAIVRAAAEIGRAMP